MLDASVIICTHDPRLAYLDRVLRALRNQSLSMGKWELLVIDNASNKPVASWCDISWHPHSRHVFESELGLAAARRRGMAEAKADVLVFVDDDNVLQRDYLSVALRIGRDWPILGAWGSGFIRPEFEIDPPDHLRKFLRLLALRDIPAPRWSNIMTCHDARPLGAGLCIRASVGAEYRRLCELSTIRLTDRQGKVLLGGGDDEICWTACKQGLGMGLFPELKMTHLIPRERLTEEFFVNWTMNDTTSVALLDYKWHGVKSDSPLSARSLYFAVRGLIKEGRIGRRMQIARIRGLIHARNIIRAAEADT